MKGRHIQMKTNLCWFFLFCMYSAYPVQLWSLLNLCLFTMNAAQPHCYCFYALHDVAESSFQCSGQQSGFYKHCQLCQQMRTASITRCTANQWNVQQIAAVQAENWCILQSVNLNVQDSQHQYLSFNFTVSSNISSVQHDLDFAVYQDSSEESSSASEQASPSADPV